MDSVATDTSAGQEPRLLQNEGTRRKLGLTREGFAPWYPTLEPTLLATHVHIFPPTSLITCHNFQEEWRSTGSHFLAHVCCVSHQLSHLILMTLGSCQETDQSEAGWLNCWCLPSGSGKCRHTVPLVAGPGQLPGLARVEPDSLTF